MYVCTYVQATKFYIYIRFNCEYYQTYFKVRKLMSYIYIRILLKKLLRTVY